MTADRAPGDPEDEQRHHDLLAAIAAALEENPAEVEVGAIAFAMMKRFAVEGDSWARHWERFARYHQLREMVDVFLPKGPTQTDIDYFLEMFPRLANLKYGPPAPEDRPDPGAS